MATRLYRFYFLVIFIFTALILANVVLFDRVQSTKQVREQTLAAPPAERSLERKENDQILTHSSTFSEELQSVYEISKSKNISAKQDRIIQSFSRQLEPKHLEKLRLFLSADKSSQFKFFIIDVLSRNQSDRALNILKEFALGGTKNDSDYALQADAVQGISAQTDAIASRVLLSEIQSQAKSSFVRSRAAQLKLILEQESVEPQRQ